MIFRSLAGIALLFALVTQADSQTAPAFVAADAHPAPHRNYPFFYAVLLKPDRYVIRDATMADLIATAYSLNTEDVQGGPPWIEFDRYDIIAKVPPGASKAALKLMLRNLLAERFHLKFRDGVKPMPAYILSAAKPKFTPAEGGEFACENVDQPGSLNLIKCRNATMDDLAQRLREMAGGYLDKPVVNSTGLEGAFDFELKWNNRGGLASAGADGISIFDAVDKQLGLKLALETAPRPVVLVDSVDEKPTPNTPDLNKILPPPPPKQFEVATIKPSKPGTRGDGNIGNGQVKFNAVPLKELIDLAWDLNESDPQVIVNAPKWLEEDKYDILAKVGSDMTGISLGGNAGNLPMDIYEVQLMLQALLVERFQMNAHIEQRPIDTYTLLAANPKLKPADPANRTQCMEGPGPDGKDPRIANPVLNRLLTCRNVTMAQISQELQNVAGGYIFGPVLDDTGLKGSYDFTLSFSGVGRLRNVTAGSDGSSEPNGALSLFDALKNQLGLKLEKQKRPSPVLVIEHIEEKPTEN